MEFFKKDPAVWHWDNVKTSYNTAVCEPYHTGIIMWGFYVSSIAISPDLLWYLQQRDMWETSVCSWTAADPSRSQTQILLKPADVWKLKNMEFTLYHCEGDISTSRWIYCYLFCSCVKAKNWCTGPRNSDVQCLCL